MASYFPAFPKTADVARGAFYEFLAMALFVFLGCGAAASNVRKFSGSGEWDPAATLAIALQFGLAITTLAYATAHASGGHINCAVTWGLTLAGECHPVRAAVYLVAQLLGSVLGAALLQGVTAQSTGLVNENGTKLDRSGALGANGFQNASVTDGHAFLAEAVCTFLLVLVVLETAVHKKAVTTDGEHSVLGNKMNLAPIPIGFAVFLAHVVCIPVRIISDLWRSCFFPAVVLF
jgi:glycerol uptake facilitator-like aquaporin